MTFQDKAIEWISDIEENHKFIFAMIITFCILLLFGVVLLVIFILTVVGNFLFGINSILGGIFMFVLLFLLASVVVWRMLET